MLKNSSRNSVLLVFSIAISFVFAAGALLFSKLFYHEINWNFIFSVFCISLSSALLLSFLLKYIVLIKIDKLLTTLRNYRLQSDKLSSPIEYSNNEIKNLSNEISAWAEDRKEEIERLKKLELYRREFLGNVSHELKTPIFNIQGYVLTLLDGGLEDHTINRNYLQRAEKSIDRMITIIYDLEAISQLETGELQLDQERFDVALLIKEVMESEEMKATEKGIILTFPEGNKPLFVFADRFRIRQVLVNLVVNSIKYGKEYGETKIRVYDVGENVSIELSDNGIGISSEHLPRLFERFYRVDKGRSREQGGTGLGLSIVKHIIEAHSQTINVMSTQGVGTVFSFSLKKG